MGQKEKRRKAKEMFNALTPVFRRIGKEVNHYFTDPLSYSTQKKSIEKVLLAEVSFPGLSGHKKEIFSIRVGHRTIKCMTSDRFVRIALEKEMLPLRNQLLRDMEVIIL